MYFEQVSYFVDTMPAEDLKNWMRELGVTLPDELDGRQNSFLEADQTYCPDGTFKVERMIDTLTRRSSASTAAPEGARNPTSKSGSTARALLQQAEISLQLVAERGRGYIALRPFSAKSGHRPATAWPASLIRA